MKLGYWFTRGIGQPIRFLLEYAGADYEEVRYTFQEPNKWFSGDKESLELDYPNLPYLFDGDLKFTQSRALLLYLTKKYKLAGASGEEEIRALTAYDAFLDLRSAYSRLANDAAAWEKEKDKFVAETVPQHLKRFEAVLEKHKGTGKWVAGTDTPSYVDFTMYDVLDQLFLLSPALMEKFPNLKALHTRVEDLPQIREYKERTTGPKCFVDKPYHGPYAPFGAAEA